MKCLLLAVTNPKTIPRTQSFIYILHVFSTAYINIPIYYIYMLTLSSMFLEFLRKMTKKKNNNELNDHELNNNTLHAFIKVKSHVAGLRCI